MLCSDSYTTPGWLDLKSYYASKTTRQPNSWWKCHFFMFFFYGHSMQGLFLKTYSHTLLHIMANYDFRLSHTLVSLYRQFMTFMQPCITIHDLVFFSCFLFGGQPGTMLKVAQWWHIFPVKFWMPLVLTTSSICGQFYIKCIGDEVFYRIRMGEELCLVNKVIWIQHVFETILIEKSTPGRSKKNMKKRVDHNGLLWFLKTISWKNL